MMFKALILPILVSLFIFQLATSNDTVTTSTAKPPVHQIDCGAACNVRCSKSSRPNLCERACGTCCARCNCVPSGTYGHYDECPCYRDMTTRGGEHKCP